MSASQGHNQVSSSSLERYIRSLPDIDQGDLDRTDFPAIVHRTFLSDVGGSTLGTQPLCTGHGGPVFASRYPDLNDVQVGRIRLRDCIELAETWLSTSRQDNATISRLRGHWRIRDWIGSARNSLTIIQYKTFTVRIVADDPTQTVLFGSQDLYKVLTRFSTHLSDELPPIQGTLQYQDSRGGSPPASFSWQILPSPRETTLQSTRYFRAWRQAAEEHHRRAHEAQLAIRPQTIRARDVAVGASLGGGRLDGTDAMLAPRSVEDWGRHTFDTWTGALQDSFSDPAVYRAPVAPSRSDMVVHAVDHVLDRLNAGVVDDYFHGPEDEEGPYGPSDAQYQGR